MISLSITQEDIDGMPWVHVMPAPAARGTGLSRDQEAILALTAEAARLRHVVEEARGLLRDALSSPREVHPGRRMWDLGFASDEWLAKARALAWPDEARAARPEP